MSVAARHHNRPEPAATTCCSLPRRGPTGWDAVQRWIATQTQLHHRRLHGGSPRAAVAPRGFKSLMKQRGA